MDSGRSREMILVVEDNPDVKTVATTLLEQLNYRTIAVESAKAALDFLAAGKPVDLVFSDVMLPGGTQRPARDADLTKALSDFRPRRS
ncbi:MAG: response regulator, partial [Pseudolabrys sp.]